MPNRPLDRLCDKAAPGPRCVGVSTIRQYLRAGLIDELHALGYACVKSVAGERATHLFLRKRA